MILEAHRGIWHAESAINRRFQDLSGTVPSGVQGSALSRMTMLETTLQRPPKDLVPDPICIQPFIAMKTFGFLGSLHGPSVALSMLLSDGELWLLSVRMCWKRERGAALMHCLPRAVNGEGRWKPRRKELGGDFVA